MPIIRLSLLVVAIAGGTFCQVKAQQPDQPLRPLTNVEADDPGQQPADKPLRPLTNPEAGAPGQPTPAVRSPSDAQPPSDPTRVVRPEDVPPALRARAFPYTDDQLRNAMRPKRMAMPSLSLGEGLVPPDAAARVFDEEAEQAAFNRADWTTQMSFHWAASEVWHHPLYFEDVMLERHGHARHPLLQPFVSGGRFAGSIAALPYKMTLDPMRARVHAFGYHRPGSAAPIVVQHPRWRRDAAAVQAVTTTGLIFLIP